MNTATWQVKNEPYRAVQQPIPDDLQYPQQCTLWIDDQGDIQDSDGSVGEMFGYAHNELKERHVSMLLPDLAHFELVSQNRINPFLLYRCHCLIPFRGVNRQGYEQKYVVFLNLLSRGFGHRLTVTIRNHGV